MPVPSSAVTQSAGYTFQPRATTSGAKPTGCIQSNGRA